MAARRCPECGVGMEHIDDEPDVGIVGGWECPECELFFDDSYDEDC